MSIQKKTIKQLSQRPHPEHFLPRDISLIVSAYKDENQHFRLLKEGADRLWKKGKRREAEANLKIIHAAARDHLARLLGNRWTPVTTHFVLGMFDAVLEPSLIVNFRLPCSILDAEILTPMKSAMVEFGEHFNQSVVHLTEFGPAIPQQATAGEMVSEDTSYQKAFSVYFSRLVDVYEVADMATEAKVTNMTFGQFGHQAIVYTTGTNPAEHVEVSEQFSCFVQALKERNLVLRTEEERLMLTNYGTGFGASHSYSEARQYLEGQSRQSANLATH